MQSKFGLSLACIYKQRHATSNEYRAKRHQAVNDSESNNNYPTDNPVAKTVQNWATVSGQETENVSETSSANKGARRG